VHSEVFGVLAKDKDRDLAHHRLQQHLFTLSDLFKFDHYLTLLASKLVSELTSLTR